MLFKKVNILSNNVFIEKQFINYRTMKILFEINAIETIQFTLFQVPVYGNISGNASNFIFDIEVDVLSDNGYPEMNFTKCEMGVKEMSVKIESDSYLFNKMSGTLTETIIDYIQFQIQRQVCIISLSILFLLILIMLKSFNDVIMNNFTN